MIDGMKADEIASADTTPEERLEELMNQAGVGQLVDVFERIEERYFAAAASTTPASPPVTHATHT